MERPVFWSQFFHLHAVRLPLTRSNILCILGPTSCKASILSQDFFTVSSSKLHSWVSTFTTSGALLSTFRMPLCLGHLLMITCFLTLWFTSSKWLSYPGCHQKPLWSLTKLQGNPRMIEAGKHLLIEFVFKFNCRVFQGKDYSSLLCDQNTVYMCPFSQAWRRFTEGLNLQGYSDIASNRLPETKDSEQEDSCA